MDETEKINGVPDGLTAVAGDVMMRAAVESMKKFHIDFTDDNIKRIVAALKETMPSTLQEALADAKAAFDANMDQVAQTTFLASFSVAGIAAVKKTFHVGTVA